MFKGSSLKCWDNPHRKKLMMNKVQAMSTKIRHPQRGFFGFGLTIVILGTSQGSLAQNGTTRLEEFGLTTEALVTNIEAVETNIASCMREAGFEYVANDFNTVKKGMSADKSLPGLGEEEFIAHYGFGISTFYTGQPPQLSELATPAQIGLGEENVALFKNLAPADQVAYTRTLFGDNAEATFAVALESEDFSRTGGCTRKAVEGVFSPEQLKMTYVNPMDARIEEDPRMIAALEQYAECVRGGGFDYTHERDIEADLRNRLLAITKGAPVEALSDEAKTALSDLQSFERSLGVVALGCETNILDPVAEQITNELFTGQQQ
jgi:hypothetical protein